MEARVRPAKAREGIILPLLFRAFAALAGIGTVIVAAIGLFEIGRGVFLFIEHLTVMHEPAPAVAADVLKGIELLFLSPLPYLIVRATGRFLVFVVTRNPSFEQAPQDLHMLKVMTTTTMIAVVATDLVQHTLEQRGLAPQAALYGCLVIFVLSLYLLVLERGSRH
jgi:hypothetical protein